MKFIGAVMVFIVCAYCGFSLSDRLKKRQMYLSNIITALNLLETEISFGGSRLKRAFIRLDGASETCGLFKTAADRTETLGIKKAWREAVEEKQDELRLTNADTETLMSLGERLGMTDTENQVKNIRYVKNRLEAQLTAAQTEYKSMGRVLRSGGILAGLFLVLIFL